MQCNSNQTNRIWLAYELHTHWIEPVNLMSECDDVIGINLSVIDWTQCNTIADKWNANCFSSCSLGNLSIWVNSKVKTMITVSFCIFEMIKPTSVERTNRGSRWKLRWLNLYLSEFFYLLPNFHILSSVSGMKRLYCAS